MFYKKCMPLFSGFSVEQKDHMMKRLTSTVLTYALTDQACDEIAEQITLFCEQQKIERKDTLRYRLTAEECLLYWMKEGCEGKKVRLRMGYRMLAPFILVEAEGEPLDPYRVDQEDFGSYSSDILANLGLAPEYSYDGSCNRLLFRIQRKRPNQIIVIISVIFLAALVGILGQMFIPEAARSIVLNGIINPIYDTFFKILSCIAGPMIFLSVTWGIYGIGDSVTLGRVGKRLMLRYFGMTFLAAACCVVCFPMFGNQLYQGGWQEGQLSSIAELILGIFPSNIVEPFATGNTLQIIFLAIVIGIAMLFLGQKTSAVARGIEQVNYLVQFLMKLISRLVPFVIFLVVLNLIWSGNLSNFGNIWHFLLIYVFAALVIVAAFLFTLSARHKVNPMLILRKSMDTFLIALTTASSAMAFSSNMNVCQYRFGISPSLCSFGIPLGMVMHKPFSAVYNLLLVFYFASVYEIKCSVTWLIIAVIVCTIVAVATPPIPGGGVVAYAILFTQLGIPSEASAIAITIDMLTDFFLTAFEMLCMPFSLVNSAARLNMIDREVLRSKAGIKSKN